MVSFVKTVQSAVMFAIIASSMGFSSSSAIAKKPSPKPPTCQPSNRPSDSAKKLVPFNGSIAIVKPVQSEIVDAAGNVSFILEKGTGFSNQTGSFTAIFAFQPVSQTKFNGSIEITSGNGKDKINLSFTDAEIQFPPVDGKFLIAFPAKVTCGAGRFAKATGSIFLNGTIELEPDGDFGPTFFDFTGAISKPKNR